MITGGIHVCAARSPARRCVNTALLAIGALLANAIGTTGASVLLIRPLLRANAPRVRKAHVVVFFIFVVSNCGGLLTPLGDPPLFLGFLKGVPFAWTLRLWPQWLLVNGALLAIFNVWDQIVLRREERERPGLAARGGDGTRAAADPTASETSCSCSAIVAVIAASGRTASETPARRGRYGVQELAMALIGGAAWWVTHREHPRAANNFDFGPIIEVAVLFAGIFVTMAPGAPAAERARAGARDPRAVAVLLGVGPLSSFLDNAPTYLTFAATACGLHGVPLEGRYLARLPRAGPALGARSWRRSPAARCSWAPTPTSATAPTSW